MTARRIAIAGAKWLWPLPVAAALFAFFHFLPFEEPVRYTNNVVYLTRYASIMTQSGVFGFPPGTRFTVDPSRHPTPVTVLVTDGTHELAIEPDALTHDPERARELATSDEQLQAVSAAAVTAEKKRVIKAESDAQLSRVRDLDLLNSGQRPGVPRAGAVPPAPRPLQTSPPPQAH